jgi:hypothetical protein
MPATADVIAAGGVARTVGANTNYLFNASTPAQRAGFFSLLQDVSASTAPPRMLRAQASAPSLRRPSLLTHATCS